jgi:PAS domain S-box-containing protein
MMRRLKNLSIKHKLIVIIMLTSSTSLLIASAAFITNELIDARNTTVEQLSTLARTLGSNCTAALIFSDSKAAGETLTALNAVPQILSAEIYTPAGEHFAYYGARLNIAAKMIPRKRQTVNTALAHNRRSTTVYQFNSAHLDLAEPIRFKGEAVGTIYLRYSLKRLYGRLLWYAAVCAIIMLISLVVALVFSLKLQSRISDPILKLAGTMKRVSDEQDYLLRVEKTSQDEIGTLFEGFNDMLTQIHKRDSALHLTQFSIDHANDAAYWINSEGNFFYVNHAACKLLGYSRGQMRQMSMMEIDASFRSDQWSEVWQQNRQRGSIMFESKHRKKDGAFVPVEVALNFLEFEGSQYTFAFARDISERKELEIQLQRAQKMEAIGNLAAGVAHDLNNILGGIVSYPQLMLLELADDSPLRDDLVTIQNSGQKAAAIVQDMLTLARRSVAVKEAIQLNKLIVEYLDSPEFEKLKSYHPNVKFKTELADDLLNVLGSPVHLSKTLMNLVSNAAEAMPTGGGCVISTQNRYIDRPYTASPEIQEGEYTVLRVSDTGIGISPEDQEKIFEPFYTKKTMGRSGTGLGMSVVWGTVKDHEGFIDLKSNEGQGSCFELYFPVTREKMAATESRIAIEDYTGQERILVVDDVKEQREVAVGMLSKMGYDVLAVPNGEAAVAHLQNDFADLLLLDMIMDPGMDGLDTYKEIIKHHPRQKAIIASGYAETERVRTAQRLGAGAYIKKPYTLENLVVAVRKALDK